MKKILILLILMGFSNMGCFFVREGAILEHDQKINQGLLDTKYKDIDPKKKEMILQRKYEIGFTKDEVKMAMGSLTSPPKVLKSNDNQFDEIWYYESTLCGANDISLFFKNGVLVKEEIKEHVCKSTWQKVRALF